MNTNDGNPLLVKIVGPGDETFDEDRVGQLAEVLELDFDHDFGNVAELYGVNFTDPFIRVEFEDGHQDSFWIEEIEVIE